MTAFLSRLVVSAILLPLVFGVVWLGGWWLWGLAAIAGTIAMHEFATTTRALRPLLLAGYAGVLAALVGEKLGGAEWMLAGFTVTFVVAFVLNGFAETRVSATVAIATTVMGAAWIGLGLGHLLLLRHLPTHAQLACIAVLVTVFAADTGAYFVGRLVGHHKLAPTISPGKTWEGLVAGFAAGVAASFFALYKRGYVPIWQSLVLGVVVVFASVVGDLYESAVKRDMQVKDTGRLLGGHGGVLDRIDSLLFAGPAAYYLLVALGHA